MSAGKTGALRAGRPSESRKATTLTSLANKGPTVRINFDLERDEHRRLKMLAVQQDRSIADILREMVGKLLTA